MGRSKQEITPGCPVCPRRSRAAIERDLETGRFTVAGAAAAYAVPERELLRHIEQCGATVWDASQAGALDSAQSIMATVQYVSRALLDEVEGAAGKTLNLTRAADSLFRYLELRARALGLLNADQAAGNAGALLAVESFQLFAQAVTGELGDQPPEVRERLLRALEAEEQGPAVPPPVPGYAESSAPAWVRAQEGGGRDG